MKIFRFIRPGLLLVVILSVSFPFLVSAEGGNVTAESDNSYFRALVVAVDDSGIEAGLGNFESVQSVRVKILSGPLEGKETVVEQYFETLPSEQYLVKVGDKVVILRTEVAGEEQMFISDRYRFPAMIWLLVVFLAIAILIGHWRGLSSIIGLVLGVAIIAAYIVPGILAGKNPLAVSLIGAFIIALLSISFSHGFNKRTGVALMSTVAVLGLTAVLAVVFVAVARVYGLGTEEAFYVQVGMQNMNMKGLLLGGIILGTLGVLDDVTMAQSSSVDEIHRADPSLSFGELYGRGMSVGREHIASMVNTLALAYFGAALPLFLLFTMDKTRPFWVIANSEIIAEEIVRTLVGSVALICAVPLSTVLAAYVFSRRSKT